MARRRRRWGLNQPLRWTSGGGDAAPYKPPLEGGARLLLTPTLAHSPSMMEHANLERRKANNLLLVKTSGMKEIKALAHNDAKAAARRSGRATTTFKRERRQNALAAWQHRRRSDENQWPALTPTSAANGERTKSRCYNLVGTAEDEKWWRRAY